MENVKANNLWLLKKQTIRKRSNFPKCIRHFKELKGICVGKCINPFMKINGAAHAHANNIDPDQGWICLAFKHQLKEKYTLLHEMAHIIANKSVWTAMHGKKWRKALLEIGGIYTSYLSYYKTHEYEDYSPRKSK